jgi:hypothetical protein
MKAQDKINTNLEENQVEQTPKKQTPKKRKQVSKGKK